MASKTGAHPMTTHGPAHHHAHGPVFAGCCPPSSMGSMPGSSFGGGYFPSTAPFGYPTTGFDYPSKSFAGRGFGDVTGGSTFPSSFGPAGMGSGFGSTFDPWTADFSSPASMSPFGYRSWPSSSFGSTFGGMGSGAWPGYGSTFGGMGSGAWPGYGSSMFGGMGSGAWPGYGSTFGGMGSGAWPGYGNSMFGGFPSSTYGGFGDFSPFSYGSFPGSWPSSGFGGFSGGMSDFGGVSPYGAASMFGGTMPSYGGYPGSSPYGFGGSSPFGFGGFPTSAMTPFYGGMKGMSPYAGGYGGAPGSWLDSWSTFIDSTYTRPPTNGLFNVNFRPNNWIEFYTLTNPVRMLDRDGSRMLFLAYDLRGFKPEEVNVTMSKGDRSIVVEATSEFKDPKEHQVMRKYYRKFILPDSLKSVDLSKVDLHSSLNVNGMLTIEAVLPRMTTEEMAKWGQHSHGSAMFGATPVACKPVC